MVPTVAVHPLRASDHRQPKKATAEAVLLLDGMRCCGVKCRCSTQATITVHRTKLRRLRQAVRIEADQCDVLLTRVQAARLSSASRRFVATAAKPFNAGPEGGLGRRCGPLDGHRHLAPKIELVPPGIDRRHALAGVR